MLLHSKHHTSIETQGATFKNSTRKIGSPQRRIRTGTEMSFLFVQEAACCISAIYSVVLETNLLKGLPGRRQLPDLRRGGGVRPAAVILLPCKNVHWQLQRAGAEGSQAYSRAAKFPGDKSDCSTVCDGLAQRCSQVRVSHSRAILQ